MLRAKPVKHFFQLSTNREKQQLNHSDCAFYLCNYFSVQYWLIIIVGDKIPHDYEVIVLQCLDLRWLTAKLCGGRNSLAIYKFRSFLYIPHIVIG